MARDGGCQQYPNDDDGVHGKDCCAICGERFPRSWLNRYGECQECQDEVESTWGF